MGSVEAISNSSIHNSGSVTCYRQQMPLTFMHAGEEARILKVRGSGDMHHHLENLGFVAGTPIKVVSEQKGNLIVEIKGAQIALDTSAASKIITQ